MKEKKALEALKAKKKAPVEAPKTAVRVKQEDEKKVLEASKALAMAVKLCKPKVIPCYPITPQTHIAEEIAIMVNNGELDAKMIYVESEHSAASALVGAQACGVRSFTATCSQGFALMFEILPILSGLRLPSVMAVANRSLSAPLNIWNDHSDSVSARDQGWIQFYAETGQEALDTTILAFKVSENPKVLLPSMVCIDGFTLSHVFEPVSIPSQAKVDAFLPEYKPKDFLDPDNPKTFGCVAMPDSFMEFKKMQQDAMEIALEQIKKEQKEFEKDFGRTYGDGLLETYKLEGAEYALIGMGSLIGTARTVVDELRKEGKKVGIIKVKTLRPFPGKELAEKCKNLKGIAVIDRHISLGFEGPLFTDIKSALYSQKVFGVKAQNFIAGLGGRDITQKHLRKAFDNLINEKEGVWLT